MNRRHPFSASIAPTNFHNDNSRSVTPATIADRLKNGFDKFVHGACITAMKVYNGEAQRFMLSGCTYPEKIDEFKFSLASKFHEFLGSLASMAIAFNMRALAH